ncbi:MAG: hypothetical protein OHK0046_14380 [Anaerolineae bacterium]
MILEPIPPYRLDLILSVLARYTHPMADALHAGAYWRALTFPEGLALFRVVSTAPADAPRLDVTQEAGAVVPEQAVLARLGHILGVEIDHRPFYAMAQADADPRLWQMIEPITGLRFLRTDSTYEALMMTIIEQQIAWTAAQKAQRWLVEWGGQAITHDGRTFYAFPAPERIANATLNDLAPLKITFKRMQVMIDVSQQIVMGELALEAVQQLPLEAAYALLVGIKGIGHWTATWTLQRTLGVHNYVGHNDVALQAAVNHYFYGGQGRIPPQQVVDTFARYGDYAGLAANYTIMRWVLDRYAPASGMPQT